MTNTEDYKPQGTDVSVDHRYWICHFAGVSLKACFHCASWTYFHRTSQILFGIRGPLNSEPHYLDLPLLGCETTLGTHSANSTKILSSCHDRALRTEGLGHCRVQDACERFRHVRHTGQNSRYHEHKQTLDRRRNCIKTNRMRYLTVPSFPRDPMCFAQRSCPDCMPRDYPAGQEPTLKDMGSW